jgi:hypothetical protein
MFLVMVQIFEMQAASEKRAQMLARALRKLGYEVTITSINQLAPKPVV